MKKINTFLTKLIFSILFIHSTQASTMNVVFIGDAKVGKTKVLNGICGFPFRDTYKETHISNMKIRNTKLYNDGYSIQMWDTVGSGKGSVAKLKK